MLILIRIVFAVGLLVAAIYAVRYLLRGQEKDLDVAVRTVILMAVLGVLTGIGIYIESLLA